MANLNNTNIFGYLAVNGELRASGGFKLVSSTGGANMYFKNESDIFKLIRGTDTTPLFNVSNSTIQYKGQTLWCASNDGAGSGLDADLLDGKHASAFLLLTGGTLTGGLSGTNLAMTGTVVANVGFRVNQTDGTGKGLNLFGSVTDANKLPVYGIAFAYTAASNNFGTHGAVTGDWAVYMTMTGSNTRGWIFRHADTNVASIGARGGITGRSLTLLEDTGSNLITFGTGVSSGIRRMTNQNGIAIYADSSMILHAGDNVEKVITGYGITATNSSEDLLLTADGAIKFRTYVQNSFAEGKEFVFGTGGILTAPSFSGNGASLTSLNANNLSTGTVPRARLPLATTSEAGAVQIGSGASNAAAGNHGHNNLGMTATANWNGDFANQFIQGNAAANAPESGRDWYWGINIAHTSKYGGQILIGNGTARMHFRSRSGDGSGIWYRLFHTGNKPTWSEIDGKPGTFPPSSHDHNTLYPYKRGLTATDNLNNMNNSGIYANYADATATPANNYPITTAGTLYVGETAYGGNQMYHSYSSNRLFIRATNSSNGKTAWTEVLTKANSPAVAYLSTGGSGGRPTGTTRIDLNGYLYTNRLYGAVWNDYAEYFEKDKDSKEAIEPGDIVELSYDSKDEVYVKSSKAYSNNVVGVCSDEYGHCLGGNGDDKDEENFTPIGMAGRVRVKIKGVIKKGDLIVASDIPGVGMAMGEDYKPGTIIGKALENKTCEEIARVRMIIQLS